MKKFFVVFFIFLLCFSVFAADDIKENKYPSSLLAAKTGMSLGIYELWLTLNAEYDLFLLNWFAIGLEAGIHYGLSFQDLYTTANLLVKFGFFYIGGGFSYKLKESILPQDSEYDSLTISENVASFSFTSGTLIPIAKLGPGELCINTSFDWFLNDIPIKNEEREEDEEVCGFLFRSVFSTIAQVITGVLFSGKLNVEVAYSYKF